MAFTTSRISTTRSRPPAFAAGISGSSIRHSSSVRSLSYCFRLIRPFYRIFSLSNSLSEIKAILENPEVSRCINYQALHQYFTFLWTPDPLTLFDGVFKLPAGHLAVFKEGNLSVQQYWDISYPTASHTFSLSEEDLVREIRSRFASVVKSQLISDVPLGAFLSAGLDSNSIVGMMAQHTSESVRTFTISFPKRYRKGEVTLDDTEVARRAAAHYGARHTDIVVEPNVVDLLPRLVWHMDEPTADPAIITAYLVNREARKDVTVLLSGVGGDEIFGGYRKYQAHYLAQLYRIIPGPVRNRVIGPAIKSLPAFEGSRIKGYVRLAKKMVRSGSLSPRERLLMDSVYLDRDEKQALYSSSTYELVGNFDPMAQHQSYFDHVAGADFLNQMLYLDTKTFMTSLNLTYNDKMSMASSVEVRVPFLDWKFAQWVADNVPPGLKIRNGQTKYALRKAMAADIPEEILHQKKAGFGAPVGPWLRDELRPMVDELLSERVIRERGLFNPEAVRSLLDTHYSGRDDKSLQIWQFLTLELWMQAFNVSTS